MPELYLYGPRAEVVVSDGRPVPLVLCHHFAATVPLDAFLHFLMAVEQSLAAGGAVAGESLPCPIPNLNADSSAIYDPRRADMARKTIFYRAETWQSDAALDLVAALYGWMPEFHRYPGLCDRSRKQPAYCWHITCPPDGAPLRASLDIYDQFTKKPEKPIQKHYEEAELAQLASYLRTEQALAVMAVM